MGMASTSTSSGFTLAQSSMLGAKLGSIARPSLLPFASLSHRQQKQKLAIASLTEKGEYHAEKPPTPLLDTINYPIHMKNLSIRELKQVSDELRSEIIFTVSKTGGHLGSSLGVVELTVALHYVFNSPEDRILWDVGHQDIQITLNRKLE